jgi:2-keto-4-pentenoate hydratase/2-oxohepta-3-ene-1,7-dioic acid hydratase in catechol pathway
VKLISFIKDGQPGYGILDGDSVADLEARLGAEYPDLKSLLANGLDAARAHAGESDFTLDEIDELLPPIPNPGVVWCAGMNTHSHFVEAKDHMGLTEEPKAPMFFLRAAATLVGSGQDLEKPIKEPAFDYEGEIAVVIGKPCRNVSEEDALDYVAGYSCFNDGSARLFQISSSQLTTGKNAYRSGGFGPCLATADSVELDTMTLECRVNGEVRQTMPLDDLIFGFAQLISHISDVYPLQPGDVIVTGAAEGVGALRDPAVFLAPGDTIEVEVSGIGTLVNGVREQVL